MQSNPRTAATIKVTRMSAGTQAIEPSWGDLIPASNAKLLAAMA